MSIVTTILMLITQIPSPSSWEWTLDSNIISNNSIDSITIQLNDSTKILNLKISDQYGCISETQQNLFLYHQWL